MELVDDIKKKINIGDLESIKVYLNEVATLESSAPFDYIFQKVYLHTCLCIGINKRKKELDIVKKQEAIHSFLVETCYPMIPEVQRLAIRQVFPYGDRLRKD